MRLTRWIPPALWAGVIATLTSWPSPPQVAAPEGSDKLVHAVLYGVLAVLAIRAVHGGRASRARWAVSLRVVLVIAVLAALDEWHQQFIPERSMDVLDWAADVSGAVVGALVFHFFAGARFSRRETTT